MNRVDKHEWPEEATTDIKDLNIYPTSEQLDVIIKILDTHDLSPRENRFDLRHSFCFTKDDVIKIFHTKHFEGYHGLQRRFDFISQNAADGIDLDFYKEYFLLPVLEYLKTEGEQFYEKQKDIDYNEKADVENGHSLRSAILLILDSLWMIKSQATGEKILEDYLIPLFDTDMATFLWCKSYDHAVNPFSNIKKTSRLGRTYTYWFHRLEDSFVWSEEFFNKHIEMFSNTYLLQHKVYLKPGMRPTLDKIIKNRVEALIKAELAQHHPDQLSCFTINVEFNGDSYFLLNELCEKDDGPSDKEICEEPMPVFEFANYNCDYRPSGFIE